MTIFETLFIGAIDENFFYTNLHGRDLRATFFTTFSLFLFFAKKPAANLSQIIVAAKRSGYYYYQLSMHYRTEPGTGLAGRGWYGAIA